MALNEDKTAFVEEPEYQEWLKLYNIKETWDYDYRAAFEAGVVPDDDGKWPSRYKHDLSSERYLSTNDGWLDTKATDIQGESVYAPWTQVMTHEMNRADKGDFSIENLGEPISATGGE